MTEPLPGKSPGQEDSAGGVRVEIIGRVGCITLDRPAKGNALDRAMATAFAAAVHAVCDAADVRAVLLRGAGKAFCVGGDIGMFCQDADGLPGLLDDLLVTLNAAMLRLSESGLPVVSALNGAVGGGGIGIALCADFVLAAESMKLRSGYSAIGLSPDVGSSWFLSRRVGPVRAKQWFLSNQAVGAHDCLQAGAVDAVHPDAELQAQALALAEQLATGPRVAHARIAQLTDGACHRSLSEQLALERSAMVALGGMGDAREGVAAFLEKRAPQFRDCDAR